MEFKIGAKIKSRLRCQKNLVRICVKGSKKDQKRDLQETMRLQLWLAIKLQDEIGFTLCMEFNLVNMGHIDHADFIQTFLQR